jgi:hypothetical protein
MKLLCDVGHVKAHFFLFKDSVSDEDRAPSDMNNDYKVRSFLHSTFEHSFGHTRWNI